MLENRFFYELLKPIIIEKLIYNCSRYLSIISGVIINLKKLKNW